MFQSSPSLGPTRLKAAWSSSAGLTGFYTMDASRTKTDVESNAAPQRHAPSGKVTRLVALQSALNVLLTGCLLTALYVHWTRESDFSEDVHIQFVPIADIFGNTTLKFDTVQHKNQMKLTDGSRISSECRGPYVLHMYVCYISLQGQASGTLELQVTGSKEPRSTIHLQHSSSEVCRGLQSITYLEKDEEATLRLYSTEKFKIKRVTVGFNYLLGSSCEY